MLLTASSRDFLSGAMHCVVGRGWALLVHALLGTETRVLSLGVDSIYCVKTAPRAWDVILAEPWSPV